MVDVTVTSGTTEITWNNTDYTWNSVPAELTWDDSYITGHTLTAEYIFGVAESFSRASSYKRNFIDGIKVSDSFGKSFTKNIVDKINIKDNYLQSSSAIICDVVLRSAANVDLTKLRTIARQANVAGYAEGVEFLPGDYEFKEAIVGLVLTNKTTTKKVGFKEIDTYVDTPDIVDRGVITITNSGSDYDSQTGYTTVHLNKPYHFVPNVVASVVSGTTLGDHIFDPEGFTNTSFRVKIVVKGSPTTPTTGTLIWEAVGY